MKNDKQITIGAALSYANIAIGALITLFYTPFMIRALGTSEYGLYNTVASVISSLSILSFGFGSSYIRFYSKYKAEDKQGNINRLNGMFLIIFSVIGVIALVCGLVISFNLRLVFDQGLLQEELQTAKKLMLLLSINLAISFPASVFTSIISANERFIFQKIMHAVKQIASPLVCMPLLLMGYGSVGMVVSTVLISLSVDIVHIVFCIAKLNARFEFGHFDGVMLKELAVYSGFIAINLIVDQINLNVDKILLGRYCGTGSVAVYSVGFTLYNYYHLFSTSISNVFTPRIHNIWSNKGIAENQKNERLSKVFADVGRVQFMVLLLICSGLVIFGKQFIGLWAGEGFGNAYYVVMLLAISAMVPLSQNIGIEIQRAKNQHQFRSLLYACMAIVNLVLSIHLCQKYGEVGAALGTAISFLLANTLVMNVYYRFALKINVSIYWKNCIRIVVSVLPAFVFGYFVCNFFDTYRVVGLLSGIVFYTLVYLVCVLLFALNEKEKRKILRSRQKVTSE